MKNQKIYFHEYQSVEEVIAAHREIKEPCHANCLGYAFEIWPDVFSPLIAPSGYLEISFAGWRIMQGASVLDIGSGSGISSCLFALNGAKKVLGIDINPKAIKAGRTNSLAVGVEDIVTFEEGDVFETVSNPSDFEIIFANLPFTSGQPSNMFERAFYDPELVSIRKYIKSIEYILRMNEKTRAFLCSSDLEHNDLPEYSRRFNLDWRVAMMIDLGWVKLTLSELQLL